MVRNFFYLMLFLFSVSQANAQYDSKGDKNISRFKPGIMWYYNGITPPREGMIRKYDRLIFDVLYTDWTGAEPSFQQGGFNLGLNTNLMFDIPLVEGNPVSIGIGVAYSFFKYRHDGMFTIDSNKLVTFQDQNTQPGFYKSAIAGNNFGIPIELRFRNPAWKQIKIHIGGKIGFQTNLYDKTYTDVNGENAINKRFFGAHRSELTYSAHIRFGIRNYALFASYNLNPLFDKRESVDLHILQFGLSVSLF